MPLKIIKVVLGPLNNNTYLLLDEETCNTVIIDPSFEPEPILDMIQENSWHLSAIWFTHAHFDHIAGAAIANKFSPVIPIGLHPDDLPLWHTKGGADFFDIAIEPSPEPTLFFEHGQNLRLGNHLIEVRHTPGHTPGHVVFYDAENESVLCGDLIFLHGVGRTDLPGGNRNKLINSIREQIFTLPYQTRLLPGHGDPTTVKEETRENPFL